MPMLCPVGPGVVDEFIRRLAEWPQFGHKSPCRIARKLGGEAANAGRAARSSGVDVRPILLTGDDDERRTVEALARQEFQQSVFVPVLEQTRRSILLGDDCYTVRSSVTSPMLPRYAAEVVGEADLTIMAPMRPADHGFVRNVLGMARTSLLMLSNEQLHDGDAACDLGAHASLTVINAAELQTWMGTSDIPEGLRRLKRRGVQDVIVTHEQGATAVLEGEPITAIAYVVNGKKSIVGAGDTFVGRLAAGRVVGAEWREAIDLGLRGAARHVETGSPGTHEELARFATQLARVVPRSRGASVLKRATAGAAATAAIIAAWLSLT